MPHHYIFIPVFVQVLLTFVVWIAMYRTRIGEMRAKRITPQMVATRQGMQHSLTDSAAVADNFANLFEVPVLFYVLAGFVYMTGQTSWIFLGLLSGFVLLRIWHSYIHITYNHVLHRFRTYLASSLFVWAGWIWLAVQLYL